MDVAFRPANVADIDLLAQFMQEFYECDHLTFDDQVARSALHRILSDELLGRVWLIQLKESR